MHAGMRRMPVERARHAKRLGHVQAGSGPAFPALAGVGSGSGTTTTPQQGTTTTSSLAQMTSTLATSSVHSSSGTLTPSSTTPSSSSVLSSATTSSVATSAQPLGASTPTPSFVATPGSLTSTSPTHSSTPTQQPNAAAVTNNGLSGGAIAGIIAGAAIVGAALIVFFIRKTYLRRRERKHIPWTGAPALGADVLDEPKPFPGISERSPSLSSTTNTSQRVPPPSPFMSHGQSMYSTPVPPLAHMRPSTILTYAAPTPPTATYNNPTPIATYPTHSVPSSYSTGNPSTHSMTRVAAGTGISSILSPMHAQRMSMEATVKCTFVPTLPDELSITTGERVFIVERFDDGWDLCTNSRGERGMVPRECLECLPTDQLDVSWRNVRRTSSLNSDGKRS